MPPGKLKAARGAKGVYMRNWDGTKVSPKGSWTSLLERLRSRKLRESLVIAQMTKTEFYEDQGTRLGGNPLKL